MFHNIVWEKYKKKNKPPVGLEPTIYRLEVCRLIHWATGAKFIFLEVPPRFELGLPDSKSDVLTPTLWDHFVIRKLYQQDSNLRGPWAPSDFESNTLSTSLWYIIAVCFLNYDTNRIRTCASWEIWAWVRRVRPLRHGVCVKVLVLLNTFFFTQIKLKDLMGSIGKSNRLRGEKVLLYVFIRSPLRGSNPRPWD